MAAGEEFELQLGWTTDQGRRRLRRQSTGKAMIGGTRTINVGYEITVENHRRRDQGQPARPHPGIHRGRDQGPAPETNPAPAKQTDLGELTWELPLDGGQEATVRYRFTVEHPAQVTVTGSEKNP